jgi:multicomponent Na+:H+ antiporter subunit B
MTSLILSTATRFLLPLLLLFSVFLLAVGHNEPGGGFVGGLVAAGAFALYAVAYGVPAERNLLRIDPRALIPGGLLLILFSGVLPLFRGRPLLAAVWVDLPWFGSGTVALGTPLLFDAGVYLIVVGSVLTIILTLAEE